MILVLLGPPGAGKGTQAKLLARQLGLPHVSTGDMFRDHQARGTDLGRKVKAVMEAGGLVPDEIADDMVKERLSRPDAAAGFILDGYPRTGAQARFLDAALAAAGRAIDRVLDYRVPRELLVERLSGRRTCPRCGAVYHLAANPPRREGICDRDGAALAQRADDRPEAVAVRLEEYQGKTEPLERYYRERGVLSEVRGVGAPEEILAETRRLLRLPG